MILSAHNSKRKQSENSTSKLLFEAKLKGCEWQTTWSCWLVLHFNQQKRNKDTYGYIKPLFLGWMLILRC